MKKFVIRGGIELPAVGFGTYKVTEKEETIVLKDAVRAGYRYFDTASFYENEKAVGQVLKESGIPRKDFIVTSKVWVNQLGYESTKKALQESLEKLNMHYLDLYLIHWPCISGNPKEWKNLNIETWKAMEELRAAGKVKAIGVSNFLPHHLENLRSHCSVVPAVNQIEFHPGYTQWDTVEYCKKNQILVQAWSPLGRGRVLGDSLVCELADKYQVTAGQICLRFAYQNGIMSIPKASSYERMKENQDIFGFSLSEGDMRRLHEMPITGYSGEHPDD